MTCGWCSCGSQVDRRQHGDYYLKSLVIQSGIIGVDTHDAGDHQEQNICGGGKENERPASFEFLSVRTRFNQVIKHQIPPFAGAMRVAGAKYGLLDTAP